MNECNEFVIGRFQIQIPNCGTYPDLLLFPGTPDDMTVFFHEHPTRTAGGTGGVVLPLLHIGEGPEAG